MSLIINHRGQTSGQTLNIQGVQETSVGNLLIAVSRSDHIGTLGSDRGNEDVVHNVARLRILVQEERRQTLY